MADYSLTLKNATDADIEAALRGALRPYEKRASWRVWQFWIGLAWGAVLMAAADYGDLWICTGQCHAVIDAARAAAQEKGGG